MTSTDINRSIRKKRDIRKLVGWAPFFDDRMFACKHKVKEQRLCIKNSQLSWHRVCDIMLACGTHTQHTSPLHCLHAGGHTYGIYINLKVFKMKNKRQFPEFGKIVMLQMVSYVSYILYKS